MALTKRERTISLVVAGALAIFLLDQYALTPMLSRGSQIETESRECQLQDKKAQQLFVKNRKLGGKWSEMNAAGLGSDASTAESRLLHSIRDWAQDSGLNLASVKPERSEPERQFQKITFRASGTGPMSAVSKFLWQVETAKIPVRIADLQLSSRKEGMDDLSLQLSVSTLCLAQKPEAPVAVDAGGVKDRKDLDP